MNVVLPPIHEALQLVNVLITDVRVKGLQPVISECVHLGRQGERSSQTFFCFRAYRIMMRTVIVANPPE